MPPPFPYPLSGGHFQSEGSSCQCGCQAWGAGVCGPEAPRDESGREKQRDRQIEGAVFILGRRHGSRSLDSS